MVTCLPDAQVYAKQLLLKCHGYPLWVPEPYGNSVAYRTKGVRIGDVGYVTPDGAFETLFNLRAARTDPINYRGVPEGFEQVMVPVEDIVHIPHYHQSNSTVTSASAKKRSVNCEVVTPGISTGGIGVGAGAQFTWNSSEGAILHLPDGASRLTSPAEMFRDTALRGAKNWYKFANATLHRGIPNGALYLVTGCDKSRSWMVGSFSDASSDSRASLKLDVACFGATGASYSYVWETSNPAVFRTGPQSLTDAHDVLSQHRVSIAQDDEVFPLDAPRGQNQCVFLRGYRITLRTNPVSSMFGISTKVDVDSILNTNPKNIFHPPAKSPYTFPGDLPDGHNINVSAGGSKTIDRPEYLDDGEVTLEQCPDVTQPYHPSNVIANYLLRTFLNATAVIIHDDEWCSVIQDNELCFPSDETLISRIMNRFDVVNSKTSDFIHLKGPVEQSSVSTENASVPFRLPSETSNLLASDESRTPPTSEGRRQFRRITPAPRKVSDQAKATKEKDAPGTLKSAAELWSGSSYLADLSNSSRTFVENREDHTMFTGAPWDHRRGDSEMMKRTENVLTCPRSLPRKRLKPNGRPNTAPNPSTSCKREVFKAIRRQRSFEV